MESPISPCDSKGADKSIERDDYGPFEELLTVLARPFAERPDFATYALPPSEEEQRNFRTFCGT